MSLKVWLPLNGDLHNQGCSSLTVTSIESTPTYTSGKIGQCYQRINSSTQSTNGLRIENNLLDLFGSTASVAVWVKPLGTHTHYNGTILSSGNWNGKKWAFGVSQDNSKVDVLCGSYNNYITCAVPANQWTHLVSIYDNGTCTLYKNGIYVGQLVNQKAFETDATWTGICRETYASGYFGFNGCINDLRIYDHCLSAAEIKELSQGLVLHYKLDDITNGIKDSSGYNYSNTIIGNITASNDTTRYSQSCSFPGTAYIKLTSLSTEIQSISFWVKWNSIPSGQSIIYVDQKSKTGFGLASNGIIVNANQSGKTFNKSIFSANNWYHIVIISPNGSSNATRKLYVNGIEQTATSNNNSWTYTIDELQLGKRSTSSDGFNGKISDFRMYVTALSDDNVLQLYKLGAKVDNKQNIHTFEINENGSNKLLRTGVFKNYAAEPYIKLADGSYWKLLLYHQVDNGTNLFTSSNAAYNNGFGLYSRLKDINGYTYNNKYEFYVLQDDVEYRWTQTNAPFTTTSVSGFTAITGSPGGGICKCNGNTVLAATGTTSNWWRACGCYKIYNGGIPGFGGAICKKYLILYARIEEPKAQINNECLYAENFIEA